MEQRKGLKLKSLRTSCKVARRDLNLWTRRVNGPALGPRPHARFFSPDPHAEHTCYGTIQHAESNLRLCPIDIVSHVLLDLAPLSRGGGLLLVLSVLVSPISYGPSSTRG
jgi:hypothetical protein